MLLSSSYAFVSSAQEFIIGVEDVDYYPLFDFSESSVNGRGFSKELLATFFEHQGYQHKFLPLPIKRFDKWFIEEGIDFKFPDNARWRTGESKKLKIIYSRSVVGLTAGTYVLKKNKHLKREQVSSLVSIFGFYPTLWYDRIKAKKLKFVEEHTPFGVVKHLLHGNMDATNIDANVIAYNLRQQNLPLDTIVLNANIHNETYTYHLSSIKYPKVIKQFNEFLLTHESLVKSLKKKYNITDI